MAGAHSILPPSGAGAWRRCAMWVTMNRLYPQPDTPESLEGTAAHWVFAEMLAGRECCEGQVTPNNNVVTEEMIEGGELVVDTVALRIPAGTPIYIEQPVAIPGINEHCWGTPDIWAHYGHTLEVLDYKFGHRFVDEFENDQGVAYIDGIIDFLAHLLNTPAGTLDQALIVNFTVIQPRCFYKGAPVRTWTVRASDLRGQRNILHAAALVALGPNPTATTNSECRHCPGRHACAALQQAAYSDAEFAVTSSPVELAPEAASLELRFMERALERLQSRVDGMQETVKAHVKRGHRLPYHHVESTFGRTVWIVPHAQILALGSIMGVDLSNPGTKTPGQAAKLGVDESVIKAYSITPPGSLKLVSDNPADVRRIFGK